MIRQHCGSLRIGCDLVQGLLIEAQVQQQRPEAGLQNAEKGRHPQGRIFHFESKKSALFSGKLRMEHPRNAVGKLRQLRIAHAQRAAGAILLGKRRVRKFRGKNVKNIFKPAL